LKEKKLNILFVSSGNSTNFDIVPFIKSQGTSLIKLGNNVTFYTVKGKGLAGYLKNIPRLRKLIKTNNFDILHAHFAYCGWVSLLTFTKIPKVLSLMGGDAYGEVNKTGKMTIFSSFMIFQGQLIQFFYKKIIVKSQNLEKYVRNKSKVNLIPNGVDFEKFNKISTEEARFKIGLPKDKILLLFIGNPNDPRKNLKLLEEASRDFDFKDYEIVKPYPISHDLVPYYFNACDVFVFPSYLEGSPNVIKEAMACNVKIVATPSGDIKERSKGVTNFWLSEFNPISLSNNIKEAIQYKGLLNSREKLQPEFDESIIALKILKIYSELIR